MKIGIILLNSLVIALIAFGVFLILQEAYYSVTSDRDYQGTIISENSQHKAIVWIPNLNRSLETNSAVSDNCYQIGMKVTVLFQRNDSGILANLFGPPPNQIEKPSMIAGC